MRYRLLVMIAMIVAVQGGAWAAVDGIETDSIEIQPASGSYDDTIRITRNADDEMVFYDSANPSGTRLSDLKIVSDNTWIETYALPMHPDPVKGYPFLSLAFDDPSNPIYDTVVSGIYSEEDVVLEGCEQDFCGFTGFLIGEPTTLYGYTRILVNTGDYNITLAHCETTVDISQYNSKLWLQDRRNQTLGPGDSIELTYSPSFGKYNTWATAEYGVATDEPCWVQTGGNTTSTFSPKGIGKTVGVEHQLEVQATTTTANTIIIEGENAAGTTVFSVDLEGDVRAERFGAGITATVPIHAYITTPTANQVLIQAGTGADASRFSVDEDGDLAADGTVTAGGYAGNDGVVRVPSALAGGSSGAAGSPATNELLWGGAITASGIIRAATQVLSAVGTPATGSFVGQFAGNLIIGSSAGGGYIAFQDATINGAVTSNWGRLEANSTGMRFYTNKFGSGTTEKLRISRDGDVQLLSDSGSNGQLGIGTAPSAALHVVRTTEQLRVGYDASNYAKNTVASDGALTIATVGTDADLTLGTPAMANAIFIDNSAAAVEINADDFVVAADESVFVGGITRYWNAGATGGFSALIDATDGAVEILTYGSDPDLTLSTKNFADAIVIDDSADKVTVNGDLAATGRVGGAPVVLTASYAASQAVSSIVAGLMLLGDVNIGGASSQGFVAHRSGSIVGISVMYDVTAEGGPLAMYSTVEGTLKSTTGISSTVGTDKTATDTFSRGTYTFSAGDVIQWGIRVISGSPTTVDDVICSLEIIYD